MKNYSVTKFILYNLFFMGYLIIIFEKLKEKCIKHHLNIQFVVCYFSNNLREMLYHFIVEGQNTIYSPIMSVSTNYVITTYLHFKNGELF